MARAITSGVIGMSSRLRRSCNVGSQPRFVTMRGGEYLFRPSMSGLRRLAEDRPSA
jgi:hypothetical protein